MIVNIRDLKFALFFTVHTLCVIHSAQSYPNTRPNDSGFLSFTNTSPSSYQREKSAETQISVKVRVIQNTTMVGNLTNADEVNRLIDNAIKDGIFPSNEEWENSRKNCSVENGFKNGTCGKTVKRRNDQNGDENFMSDQAPTGNDDDRIHFPGDTMRFIPLPSACKGATLCEDVPNYPEQFIRSAVRRHKTRLFSSSDESLIYRDTAMIDQRIAPNFPEEQLCDTEVNKVQPRVGKTVGGEWRYIVNAVENVTHIVMLETCRSENNSCNILNGYPGLAGYDAICMQKHIHREMHVLNPVDGSIEVQTFRIPASCCCILRYNDKISDRMGRTRTSRGA